jgi:N-acetylneuraminate synthase
MPLVGRTTRIARAVTAGLADECRIVCSTDNPAIADAARSWGAEVPFLRPEVLAADETPTLEVVRHALMALDEAWAEVVLLQPTSPLIEPADVIGAMRLFRETRGPVVSVCAAEHPIEWHVRLDDACRLSQVLPRDGMAQRQKALPVFRPNGAIYVASPDQIRAAGFWTDTTRGFVMPAERSLDVDTAADLEVARALLAARCIAPIEIAGRRVGPGQPCFIIAEAGVNHNGSLDMAIQLVDAAASAGADAVKFQTFSAERLAVRDAPTADYQRNAGMEESQFEMLRRLELNAMDHEALVARCRQRKILFLSTPFDEGSCDLLESLDVPALKLASGELTNTGLLRHAAHTGRPLIISTGMATLREVARAVDSVRDAGNRELALLHCVSDYPADPADANVRALVTMREAFGVPTGFSDHTEGATVALAAVALGASVLEKHLTLDRLLRGPDHRSSIEPGEFRQLVQAVRTVEAALGDGRKAPVAAEAGIAMAARKSLVAASFISRGTVLTPAMVVLRRPGTGLAPGLLESLVGRRLARDVQAGVLLQPEMFE